jgi:uncharacterized protein (DUF362 family)
MVGGSLVYGCGQANNRQTTEVAIVRANNYEYQLVRNKVEDMFNQIGGIRDVIKPGDRVGIKVNLTGGIIRQGKLGYSPIDSFQTHPQVVRAVAELAIDSGAKKIFILDGIFDDMSYSATGYTQIATPLNAELLDLNEPFPYKDYIHKPVGEHAQVYQEFILNPILDELDAYISIPKLKCHQCCGVTLALKNNFGLPPVKFYDLPDEPSGARLGMHGTKKESRTRLAKVITDINFARPIDLTIIDGIWTSEGGEGPWCRDTFGLKKANVLIAGKDPVATDAVGTAVMGFDPEAADFESPFLNCENHLAMAKRYNQGTHRLQDIKILGTEITTVRKNFKQCQPFDLSKELLSYHTENSCIHA